MPKRNPLLKALEALQPSRVEDDIFQLIVWLWVEARSVEGIAQDLGFSQRTVREHLRKIRTLIEGSDPAYSTRLDGAVYADTWTYRPNQTSHSPKRPMLFGIMNAEGDLRLFVIPGQNRELIHGLVKTHVVRGAHLTTNKSNIYSGLRADGFAGLTQLPQADLHRRARGENRELNLCTIWDLISGEMNHARGVRSNNFIPRVREVELRWRFRNLPKICLFQHVIQLSRS